MLSVAQNYIIISDLCMLSVALNYIIISDLCMLPVALNYIIISDLCMLPVALNYQTPDEPMHTLQGLFRDNGGSGYTLKPNYMNKVDSNFDPNGPFPKEWRRKLALTVSSLLLA